MVAPMLPDSPMFLRHPLTGETFWSQECQEIARESPLDGSAPYAQLPYSVEASDVEIAEELSSPSLTPEKERYLRVRLWWMWNDPDRDRTGSARRPPGFDDNLKKLLKLLAKEGNDNARLMAAEAWRELGKYQEAEAILSQKFDPPFERAVSAIRSACLEGDNRVRELA